MNVAVIGMQFGDEGKGKIVDYLASDFDIIARYCGGSNAGHTVVIENKKFKLHLVPSGALRGKIGVLGNGMVIDLQVLREELRELKEAGFEPKIIISSRAHVVTPLHKEMEALEEKVRNIGTTRRGIGPTYETKVKRVGIRIIDLFNQDALTKKLRIISTLWHLDKSDEEIENIAKELSSLGKEFKENVKDTELWLNQAISAGKSVLFEGAQGTMLDVDFGTYPFVTSSNTNSLGLFPGLGIPPKYLDKVIGVAKAYTTRVGEGPFPTEIHGELADMLRNKGNEYGATTGRPRRIGWLDLPILRYSKLINGIEEIAITKIDVLQNLREIQVGVKYSCKGESFDYPPPFLENCEPVYESLDGWSSMDDEEFQRYLRFIEENISVKIKIVSYGAEREKTMRL